MANTLTDVSLSQNDATRLQRLEQKVDPKDREQIRKVSEDFESIFLGIVLKSMRQTVQKSGLMDGGNAEDIYRSMLDDEYAKMMAEQRHTGLADNIEEFLLRSYGDIQRPEGQVEQAIGMKTYQQQALQNSEKQARIDTSGIPSVPVANDLGKNLVLKPGSLSKPL